MEANKISLPKTLGDWSRLESPGIIDSSNIFKYMNGAGEIYLGYRFNHLEVFDYTSKNNDNILVELYFMETPADAFGLLSLDWGGEVVSLNDASANGSKQSPSSDSQGRTALKECWGVQILTGFQSQWKPWLPLTFP